MNEVTISLDSVAFLRQLTNLEVTQLPKAGSLALNDTAYDVLKDLQGRMDVVFDRPTRWTKNAFTVQRATPETLEAQVKERPLVVGRHYLKVQETGGQRPQTGMEQRLSTSLAYNGILAAVVPATGARLDGFGNWSSGERNQVLSQLKAQKDSLSNETEASRKRKRNKPSPGRYFVPKSEKVAGVYRRDENGKVTKVLNITDSLPSYTPRLGFYDNAAEIWAARLPYHLRRHLDGAVAAAK